MRVVITGSSGFIGRRLAARLLDRGSLTAPNGTVQTIEKLVLFDVAVPDDALGRDRRVEQIAGDIADSATVARAVGTAGGIFHFGAVVSAGAEADFELGMRVNLDGTRNVLEACRRLAVPPRLIFSSSEAVYGARASGVVDDDTPLYPQTSYGTQKACGELLVQDYSRKGYVDGRALRFPTIVVRNEPNMAASTFTSSIIREPLLGRKIDCPVRIDSVMAVMSVQRVLEAIEHCYELPSDAFGAERSLLLPAVAASVESIIQAVGAAAGPDAASRITVRPDPRIQAIVDSWPRAVVATRAAAMGIRADSNIEEIVRSYLGGLQATR